MKRLYRIIRIWLAGKYKYLKRVNKWMRGRFLRDLQLLTPQFTKAMMQKYNNENFVTIMDEIGRMKLPNESITFKHGDKPKYIEDGTD